MASEPSDTDAAADAEDAQHRLAEKELFLLLLVAVAVLMALLGFVLVVT